MVGWFQVLLKGPMRWVSVCTLLLLWQSNSSLALRTVGPKPEPQTANIGTTLSEKDLQNRLPPCPEDQGAFFDNCFGTYIFGNGTKYVGEWKNDRMHGIGTATNPKGFRHIGGWEKGVPHGQGMTVLPDGSKYVGELRNGIRSGQGTFIFGNGDQYIGQWKDDLPHGHGKELTVDGSRYVGGWKEGEKSGLGAFITDSGEYYVGNWVDGEPERESMDNPVEGEWDVLKKYVMPASFSCSGGKITTNIVSGRQQCPGKVWVLVMVLYKAPSEEATNWRGPWSFALANEYGEVFESKDECQAAGASFKENLSELILVPKRYRCVGFDAGLPTGASR